MSVVKSSSAKTAPPVSRDTGGAVAGRTRLVYAAAALSLAASLVHLWAAPEHLEEWWGYGVFFLSAAAAQGLFSVLLLHSPESQLIPIAGILGNLAIVLLYLLSHTSGLPLITLASGVPLFGPHAGDTEEVGMLDLGASACEMALIVVLISMLGERYRRIVINLLLALMAGIWAVRLLG